MFYWENERKSPQIEKSNLLENQALSKLDKISKFKREKYLKLKFINTGTLLNIREYRRKLSAKLGSFRKHNSMLAKISGRLDYDSDEDVSVTEEASDLFWDPAIAKAYNRHGIRRNLTKRNKLFIEYANAFKQSRKLKSEKQDLVRQSIIESTEIATDRARNKLETASLDYRKTKSDPYSIGYKEKNYKFINLNNLKNLQYNTYLNLHFLYQDYALNKFINIVLLRKGKKQKAFNILLLSLKLLKTLTNISPFRIFKSLLKPEKLLLTHFVKTRGSRILNIPQLSYKKTRYESYFFFLKNQLKNISVEKQFLTHQKLAYLVVTNLLSKNKDWFDLIEKNAKSFHTFKRFLQFKNY